MRDLSKRSQANAERDDLDDDIDALFKLPLAEFTAARNTLAARLKKSARGDAAALVKALNKPSISAWAVNQLHWDHHEAFDQLIASGERFHKVQSSGKLADMRGVLDARREALTHLSDLAGSMLRDAGHSPTPDTIHRITTTLEALSVAASRSDAARPGRLTHDIDPPGFESFGSMVPRAAMTPSPRRPAPSIPSRKVDNASPNKGRKLGQDDDVGRIEEARKAKIATAKASQQDAKRSLSEARAKAQSLDTARKKADADAQKAEKQKRAAELALENAKALAEDAATHARRMAVEVDEAASALEDAERTLEEATQKLDALLQESSGR